MGCLYAEGSLEKCQCPCKGERHGLLAENQPIVAAKCSPAVEKRCKAGIEGGECHCACAGLNHGLYAQIEHFEDIPIRGYATV